MIYNQQAFWRETMKPARFLIFDARLVLFVGLFLLHMQVWTAVLMVSAALGFTVCEKMMGLDFNNLLRWIRSSLVGPHRPARGRSAPRQAVDFAFELRPAARRRLAQRQARAAAKVNAAINPSKPAGWLAKLGFARS